MQGHIWRTGFESNELEGEVFDDVPEALEKWHSLGTKVFSFSFSFSCRYGSKFCVSHLFVCAIMLFLLNVV